MNKLFIISEPIKTGKTALLFNWIKQQTDVAGILSPDVDDKRMLFDIQNQTYHPFQINNGESGIQIGRFTFDTHAFKKAHLILKQALTQQSNWLVIDEIGRLEIDHSSGFEPMVSECIESVKTSSHNTKLLLVIRDYLLEKAIAHYQLQDAIVLPRAFFELTPDSALSGLVLCGGLSSRMRQDKSMMMYHKAPQYMHLGHMLKLCCDNVFLSARAEQTSQYATFPVITDHHAYANAGPLTGLLSAFHQLPNQSVLLLGCDYPYLTLTQIIELLQQRHKGYDVICFKNTDSGYAEPLIAVYEKSCIPKLKQFFASGQQSLRHFLQTVNTCYLTTNNKNIISVDFPIN